MNAKFTQRMPDELHAKVKALAARRGITVTDLLNSLVSEEVESDEIEALKAEIVELKKQLKTKK